MPGPNKRKVDHMIPVSMKTMVSSIHFGKFLVSGPACALLYVSWFSDAVRAPNGSLHIYVSGRIACRTS